MEAGGHGGPPRYFTSNAGAAVPGRQPVFSDVIAQTIFGLILNQPMELKLGKNHPPFSKGGQGGLNKRLIIPLNPPLKKGDFTQSVFKI
jgi:hypothetical protein